MSSITNEHITDIIGILQFWKKSFGKYSTIVIDPSIDVRYYFLTEDDGFA